MCFSYGLGLSRCLGPGECLHSFMCFSYVDFLLISMCFSYVNFLLISMCLFMFFLLLLISMCFSYVVFLLNEGEGGGLWPGGTHEGEGGGGPIYLHMPHSHVHMLCGYPAGGR